MYRRADEGEVVSIRRWFKGGKGVRSRIVNAASKCPRGARSGNKGRSIGEEEIDTVKIGHPSRLQRW